MTFSKIFIHKYYKHRVSEWSIYAYVSVHGVGPGAATTVPRASISPPPHISYLGLFVSELWRENAVGRHDTCSPTVHVNGYNYLSSGSPGLSGRGPDYLEAIRFPRTRSSDPFCARCRQILTHLPPYISCPWKLACCYTKQYRGFIAAARGVNIVASRCRRLLSRIVIWFNFLSNNANALSVDIYG